MDIEAGGRWLTYDELAEARNIRRAAAVRLTQRKNWPRQPGNDGRARVLVPLDWIPDHGQDTGQDAPTAIRQDGLTDAALAAIREAHAGEVAALRGEIETLKVLADAKDARLVDAETRAERERLRAEGLQERLSGADRELAVAQHDAEAAQEAAAKLRLAEDARKARGRLRRVWAAWRGE
jgi:hypothetical protein